MIEVIAQNLYQKYNFHPGDHFGFYCQNQAEYLILLLAVWRLRGVYVGISEMLGQGE